jgi:hypothetical protein
MKTICSTLLATALAFAGTGLQAETVRDCVLEGTVKKHEANDDKVYVAFHSYRAAEEGANCRLRRKEKLHFKQPASSEINTARPGSKVQYRYTEDSKTGSSWELKKVSNQSQAVSFARG